jgi:hypothetical protein
VISNLRSAEDGPAALGGEAIQRALHECDDRVIGGIDVPAEPGADVDRLEHVDRELRILRPFGPAVIRAVPCSRRVGPTEQTFGGLRMPTPEPRRILVTWIGDSYAKGAA